MFMFIFMCFETNTEYANKKNKQRKDNLLMATTQNEKDISSLMAETVNKLVDYKVKKAGYDKTYSGIISAILFEPNTDIKDINFGTYKIRFNNMEKTYRFTDGIVHQVGERVNVYVPENNPNRIIVEPLVKSVIPYKIVYDDINDKIIEYRKVDTDGKTYETISEYELVIENKGTETEKIIKITLPNRLEIEFDGWE